MGWEVEVVGVRNKTLWSGIEGSEIRTAGAAVRGIRRGVGMPLPRLIDLRALINGVGVWTSR